VELSVLFFIAELSVLTEPVPFLAIREDPYDPSHDSFGDSWERDRTDWSPSRSGLNVACRPVNRLYRQILSNVPRITAIISSIMVAYKQVKC